VRLVESDPLVASLAGGLGGRAAVAGVPEDAFFAAALMSMAAEVVNGHRFLLKYGHRFSPPAAIFSPHWWP